MSARISRRGLLSGLFACLFGTRLARAAGPAPSPAPAPPPAPAAEPYIASFASAEGGGQGLVYSTYLGGSPYVTGMTTTTYFPGSGQQPG
jgi:hypothetical protein